MDNQAQILTNEQTKNAKVLVVGDVMLDRYWFGEVDRISPEAPVPVVHINQEQDCLGGAANVARNIVSLGGQVSLVGIVGADKVGHELIDLLEAHSIDAHLIVDPAIPSILKMRILGRQQQLIRIDFEAKPQLDTVTKVYEKVAALIQSYDVVVLSDYAKGTLSQVEPIIALAKRLGKPILVDPKGDQYHRYIGASLLTPNRSEMAQAVGRWHSEEELQEKAWKLCRDLDLGALLVTRSEQGMTLYEQGQRCHVDAQAHEVFDVSGAGDSVLATLAVCCAIGMPWNEAVYWANLAGSVVVGKLGTSTISVEELQQCIS